MCVYIYIYMCVCVCVCVCVCAHICIYICIIYIYMSPFFPLCVCVLSYLVMLNFFCNSMHCSPPGVSVQGFFEARVLEWVAISYSSGSFLHRDQIHVLSVSCLSRQILYHHATWEAISPLDCCK